MKPNREGVPEVTLHLGDHPPRPVAGRRLILKTAIPNQRSMARSGARPSELIFNAPFQHVVGAEVNWVSRPSAFQGLVEDGQGKPGVRADDDGLPRSVTLQFGERVDACWMEGRVEASNPW
jgi:hypothetical protein